MLQHDPALVTQVTRPVERSADFPAAGLWLALARRIVPAARDLGPAGERRFLGIIEDAVASRPELARPLALFLGLVRWVPVLRHGARFEKLAPAAQDAFLHRLERSRLRAIRTGFAGVRTLVLMGYYARPEVGRELHYAPSRAGNEVLARG